ncbi:hypothetical protein Peur_042460 [Populus x canadensis]
MSKKNKFPIFSSLFSPFPSQLGSINLGFFDESQNSESTFSFQTIRILSFCRICIYFRLRIVYILLVWEETRWAFVFWLNHEAEFNREVEVRAYWMGQGWSSC